MVRLVGPASRTSHAEVFQIHQHGDRSLWDEVEATHHGWDGLGQPPAGRWGITVTPDGQQLWLDTGEHPIHGDHP